MRVIAVILLIIIHTGTDARAQVSFDSHRRKEPLRKVLEDIRIQTGYLFFFQNEPTLLDQRVTVAFTHMSIDTFLKVYLGVEPDDYKLLDKTYLIKRKNTGPFGANYSNIATLIDVEGSITDMKGDPLSDVTIALDGKAPQAITDSMGNFRLNRVAPDAVLLFWHVSMDHLRVPLDGRASLSLRMKEKPAELQNVTVVHVTTGYERVPQERATGSFGFIDRALINRGVSTFLPDRMENLIAGVFTNHIQTPAGVPATDMPLIRGRSTLFANALPLIILDNFPYDGDINNINPNDVEGISILKDAAASSIWGARAGNGVIVITTRKGKVNDSSMYSSLRPNFSYNSAVTFQAAPDLFKVSSISSADFIDRERDLYNRGLILPDNSTPETPVVSLLRQVSNNTLTEAAANAGIEALKTIDVRRAMQQYFYRRGIEQQHFLQASSSTENAGYYVSAGWDHNLYNLAGSSYDRVSLRVQNVYRISAPFYIETGVNFTHTTDRQDANPGYNYRSPTGRKGFYPYARLVDALGNPLPVSLDYGADYLLAAAAAGFPDWSFAPVKDGKMENNTMKAHDLLINIGTRYTFMPSLNLEVKYQYQNGGGEGTDLHDANSYYTRDLINRYAQMDPVTNRLRFPVPQGGIMDFSHRETIAHQGRLQLNYNHTWSRRNHMTAIAGYEIRSMENSAWYDRQYGFKPDDNSSIGGIDYSATYSTWQLFNPPASIPRASPSTRLTDHFISYYTNASYNWHDLLTVSGSAREDFANLFGANTNQKKVPLWSAGLAWQINNSEFYNWKAFSSLKLRATYGRGGNISRQASAYTTAIYAPLSAVGNSGDVGLIQGLSNPNLRWEQVGMFNMGLDFVSRNKIIAGSIEYYHKEATDLMAPAEGDPTLGLVQTPGQPGIYYGNTASMQGAGIDLQLETHNLNGKLRWTTNFILSRNTSRVTKYLLPVTNGYTYLDQTAISPLIGKPLYAIYSYRWAGLDPTNGDPQGYYNGKTSKDWTSIKTNTPIDSMVYNGSSQPTVYGALRNTFRWRAFTASFNISYKFGYYFRRPSINYTGLFQTWAGHGDYARRWRNPGDEHNTFVPSVSDPVPDRDLFYLNSSVLVERADHIRLEDVQLSYEFSRNRYGWLPFNNIRLYTYLSNLGVLWTANKERIDPYYINIPPEGKRISVGLNVNF